MPIDASPQADVWVVRAGVVPYEQARLAQRRLEEARIAREVPDVLLLLEHPPVYTRGRRSTPDELPMGEEATASGGSRSATPTAAAASPTTAPASSSGIRSSR